MRMNRRSAHARCEPLEARLLLATFTVTTVADSGAGSLRQAILDANAAPDADVIDFDILEGDSPVKTIVPDALLPSASAPVTIDGTTQPGYASTPLIEIDGIHTSVVLELGEGAARSVVRGLCVTRSGTGIRCAAPDTTIEKNFVGTDPSGTVARGNANGVVVSGARCGVVNNVISGNNLFGVTVSGSRSAGVVIAGNLIGVNAAASAALKNFSGGVLLNSVSGQTRVGGLDPADRNVIGGNGAGVSVQSSGNLIEGNLIGPLPGGSSAPNGTGVAFFSANGNLVRGNTIAFNTTGVAVRSSARNGIVENRIYSNNLLGIDLGEDGVTPNDAGDADAGGNGLQNFPVLASARSTGDTTVITGSLDSLASSKFRLDFYANAFATTELDPTGYGEGARPVGNAEVTTDSSGHADFTATVPSSLAGDLVTTTASRIAGPDLETSEFSHAIAAASTSGPLVRRVFVRGQTWATNFLVYAQNVGLGSFRYGVSVPAGPQQLAALPWMRTNQVSIEFSETVQPTTKHLTVHGARVANYAVTGVSFDPNSHTAIFTVSPPIENDKIVIRLDADSPTGITAGGKRLDGDWTDGAGTFPSGDGTPGGDFVFRFNVLAGDVNRSGQVVADDASAVKRRFFSTTASPGSGAGAYSLFADVNASGGILADDFSEVKKRFFSSLPTAEPAAVTIASAPWSARPLMAASIRRGLLR